MNILADKQLFWRKLNGSMFVVTFVDPLGVVHANYSLKCYLFKVDSCPGVSVPYLNLDIFL